MFQPLLELRLFGAILLDVLILDATLVRFKSLVGLVAKR